MAAFWGVKMYAVTSTPTYQKITPYRAFLPHCRGILAWYFNPVFTNH